MTPEYPFADEHSQQLIRFDPTDLSTCPNPWHDGNDYVVVYTYRGKLHTKKATFAAESSCPEGQFPDIDSWTWTWREPIDKYGRFGHVIKHDKGTLCWAALDAWKDLLK